MAVCVCVCASVFVRVCVCADLGVGRRDDGKGETSGDGLKVRE